MYFVYLAVCFLGFLPNTVFALPSAIPTQLMHPTTEAPSPQLILHPGIHPDEDLSDLENLKAKKSSSLYYAALPGSPMGGASVVKLTHLYPAVVLEHSHFVTAVTCNAASNSISVTFADPSSFRTAFDSWGAIRTGFLLISNVPGCGSGTDSLERSFHLISRLVGSEKDLRIVCQAQTIPIHHTVHRDQEIRVHAATYEVEHHRRSNQRNSHSAGATTAALSHPIHNTNTTGVAVHLQERGMFDFVVNALGALKHFYPPATLSEYLLELLLGCLYS
ncbi:hypothetical protein FB451DRAFT_1149532 [Mycena latifolia]|nr:hypothetical protein FB451DRAFT_1149532 [Mycena latifolia]